MRTGRRSDGDKSPRLADRAYHELLRLITTGELEPNTRLTEFDLCDRLGMSRTPIRQALHQLVAEGLLCSTPHCGVTVRELTSQEVIDLYLVREAVECQAARLVASRVTEGELDELRAICVKMAEQDRGDGANHLYMNRELDSQFHHRLVELSGVKSLSDIYRHQRLLQLHMFARHVSRLPQHVGIFGRYLANSCEEHMEMVDAIASGDPQKAEDAVRAAMQRAIRRTREGLASLEKGSRETQRPAACLEVRPARRCRHAGAGRRRSNAPGASHWNERSLSCV
jgi:DNA-binding GntR family transcriptional regulator